MIHGAGGKYRSRHRDTWMRLGWISTSALHFPSFLLSPRHRYADSHGDGIEIIISRRYYVRRVSNAIRRNEDKWIDKRRDSIFRSFPPSNFYRYIYRGNSLPFYPKIKMQWFILKRGKNISKICRWNSFRRIFFWRNEANQFGKK